VPTACRGGGAILVARGGGGGVRKEDHGSGEGVGARRRAIGMDGGPWAWRSIDPTVVSAPGEETRRIEKSRVRSHGTRHESGVFFCIRTGSVLEMVLGPFVSKECGKT
jgi:hypothetical protein